MVITRTFDAPARLVMTEVYPTKEALDVAIEGMGEGMPETFEQLAEFLADGTKMPRPLRSAPRPSPPAEAASACTRRVRLEPTTPSLLPECAGATPWRSADGVAAR